MIKKNNLSNLIFPFSYSNIFKNGNFDSALEWISYNSSNAVSNNILTNTGSNILSNAGMYQTISSSLPKQNDKIYQIATARVTNNSSTQLRLRLYDGISYYNKIILNPVQNEWYELSLYSTIANIPIQLTSYVVHFYADAATCNGKEMQVKQVMAINLTSLYGAGNEPSESDCANIFKFVDGNTQPNFSKQIAT